MQRLHRRLQRHGHLLFLLLGGCAAPGDAPEDGVDTTLRDSLGIGLDRTVQRISLGGAREREHVVPPTLTVAPGTVVEFYTVDRRVHSILFIEDSLSPSALAFLRENGRLSSAPLVEQGSRFVVDFMGAPDGRYPFVSRGHGESARGAILVGPEQTGG